MAYFFKPLPVPPGLYCASRRKSSAYFIALIFLGVLLAGVSDNSLAQTVFPGSSLGGNLLGDRPSLFPNNDKIKLLAIALNPSGLTESAAEQIGLILQKNLSNSGHFAVVGPREANAVFEKGRRDLVDCREIACGVDSGKRLGAQRVMVGTIRMSGQDFVLNVRLIDTLNNITGYSEEVHFNDETMDESLFRLADNISRNSLLTGRVLSTSIRGIVVSLGKQHGLKIGDVLVVYKQDVAITSLEGEKIDVQRKNIAVVKVLNVNEKSSEAIISHSTEKPQVSHFAQTYRDPARQIELAEHTRRELDTGIRLENKIRPLTLAPVLLADSERRKWRARLQDAKASQRIWMITGVAAGIATLVFLDDFSQSDTDRARTIGAGALAGYAIKRYIDLRNEINDLNVEGRQKGYLSAFNFQLDVAPGYTGVSLAYRF